MKRVFFSLLSASLLIATPASAQNNGVDKRVERLESEMRAVQRKVFPGGSRFFEPEISPEAASPTTASTTTSAVTDILSRIDALERSLASLTGQVEENGFRLKKLEDQMATGAAADSTAPVSSSATGSIGGADTDENSSGKSAETTPAPERVEAVASIVMPDTGDAGEDAYVYGFRLWDAKYFPEAQAQLKKSAEDYPKHRRASFARNLLGRAYLDDKKPALASVALYDNYQKLPRGERAPDSLIYLGTALIRLGKKPDACRVYDEFAEVYPAEATGRLSDYLFRGRRDASCN
ncbi:TPR repeat containing exported protein; Putative periplasmic protein contains a protein prenylyltransferase domain [hydrothermal vent metagenome]|uniref:TPR repeat containing exported protein Putative periplasmic protein contains a protein prenylyltransferase domain n=1 Tax=hydrothermal vent metagenome TaxID=652676 RepID=A0A3B0SVQ3_9ZZZZ